MAVGVTLRVLTAPNADDSASGLASCLSCKLLAPRPIEPTEPIEPIDLPPLPVIALTGTVTDTGPGAGGVELLNGSRLACGTLVVSNGLPLSL